MATSIIIIAGRVLLAMLFVLAGVAKVMNPQPFIVHMGEQKLPKILLPLVIGLELVAGLAVLVGWQLPIAAGALGAFCIATALVFHRELGNKVERTLFFKDLAIAGALLFVAGTSMGLTNV
ncbi:MAG TPA: DoxX family protein [Burkholderiaceae bacterium]|jgi:putative oxidoreductase